MSNELTMHATTIVTVRKGGKVVIAGDGQVSLGQTIMKGNARKVRRIGKGNVIAGFAGATADAFTLLERLEAKLEQYPDQLTRACVELAKDWRTDRYLRRLEAMMLVADKNVSLALTGTGDVLEPEHGVMAIGSGGNYALAAARALIDTDKDAEEIARKAMQIAADICVYTNNNIVVETHRCRGVTTDSPRYDFRAGDRGRPADARRAGSPSRMSRNGGAIPRRSSPRSAEHMDSVSSRAADRRAGRQADRLYAELRPASGGRPSLPGPAVRHARHRSFRSAMPELVGNGHGSAIVRQFVDDAVRGRRAARHHRSAIRTMRAPSAPMKRPASRLRHAQLTSTVRR